KDPERHLRADALHIRLQQAEPFALQHRAEAVEPDQDFAHIGLYGQHHRLARSGQGSKRASRTEGDIADAMHVDDAMHLADLVDDALELSDHGCASLYPAASIAAASLPVTLWR